MMDYSKYKLPRWSNFITPRNHKKFCARGMHVPAKAENDDGTFEIFCQYCVKTLTEDDWNNFWRTR